MSDEGNPLQTKRSIRDLFREVAATHGITGVDYSEPTGHYV